MEVEAAHNASEQTVVTYIGGCAADGYTAAAQQHQPTFTHIDPSLVVSPAAVRGVTDQSGDAPCPGTTRALDISPALTDSSVVASPASVAPSTATRTSVYPLGPEVPDATTKPRAKQPATAGGVRARSAKRIADSDMDAPASSRAARRAIESAATRAPPASAKDTQGAGKGLFAYFAPRTAAAAPPPVLAPTPVEPVLEPAPTAELDAAQAAATLDTGGGNAPAEGTLAAAQTVEMAEAAPTATDLLPTCQPVVDALSMPRTAVSDEAATQPARPWPVIADVADIASTPIVAGDAGVTFHAPEVSAASSIETTTQPAVPLRDAATDAAETRAAVGAPAHSRPRRAHRARASATTVSSIAAPNSGAASHAVPLDADADEPVRPARRARPRKQQPPNDVSCVVEDTPQKQLAQPTEVQPPPSSLPATPAPRQLASIFTRPLTSRTSPTIDVEHDSGRPRSQAEAMNVEGDADATDLTLEDALRPPIDLTTSPAVLERPAPRGPRCWRPVEFPYVSHVNAAGPAYFDVSLEVPYESLAPPRRDHRRNNDVAPIRLDSDHSEARTNEVKNVAAVTSQDVRAWLGANAPDSLPDVSSQIAASPISLFLRPRTMTLDTLQSWLRQKVSDRSPFCGWSAAKLQQLARCMAARFCSEPAAADSLDGIVRSLIKSAAPSSGTLPSEGATVYVVDASTSDSSATAIDAAARDALPCDDTWTTRYQPRTHADIAGHGAVASVLRAWLQRRRADSVVGTAPGPVSSDASSDSGESSEPRTSVRRAVALDSTRKRAHNDDLSWDVNLADRKRQLHDDMADEQRAEAAALTSEDVLRRASTWQERAASATVGCQVLVGPHGCGKTALVYALARELGFNVIEVSASGVRNRKTLEEEIKEATQSHRIQTGAAAQLPMLFRMRKPAAEEAATHVDGAVATGRRKKRRSHHVIEEDTTSSDAEASDESSPPKARGRRRRAVADSDDEEEALISRKRRRAAGSTADLPSDTPAVVAADTAAAAKPVPPPSRTLLTMFGIAAPAAPSGKQDAKSATSSKPRASKASAPSGQQSLMSMLVKPREKQPAETLCDLTDGGAEAAVFDASAAPVAVPEPLVAEVTEHVPLVGTATELSLLRYGLELAEHRFAEQLRRALALRESLHVSPDGRVLTSGELDVRIGHATHLAEDDRARLTLLLIEDVDIVMDSFCGGQGGSDRDRGFMTALRDVVEEARCPVVLTSAEPLTAARFAALHDLPLEAHIMTAPTLEDAQPLLHAAVTAELLSHTSVSGPEAEAVLRAACAWADDVYLALGGDVRQTLVTLQFWLGALPVCPLSSLPSPVLQRVAEFLHQLESAEGRARCLVAEAEVVNSVLSAEATAAVAVEEMCELAARLDPEAARQLVQHNAASSIVAASGKQSAESSPDTASHAKEELLIAAAPSKSEHGDTTAAEPTVVHAEIVPTSTPGTLTAPQVEVGPVADGSADKPADAAPVGLRRSARAAAAAASARLARLASGRMAEEVPEPTSAAPLKEPTRKRKVARVAANAQSAQAVAYDQLVNAWKRVSGESAGVKTLSSCAALAAAQKMLAGADMFVRVITDVPTRTHADARRSAMPKVMRWHGRALADCISPAASPWIMPTHAPMIVRVHPRAVFGTQHAVAGSAAIFTIFGEGFAQRTAHVLQPSKMAELSWRVRVGNVVARSTRIISDTALEVAVDTDKLRAVVAGAVSIGDDAVVYDTLNVENDAAEAVSVTCAVATVRIELDEACFRHAAGVTARELPDVCVSAEAPWALPLFGDGFHRSGAELLRTVNLPFRKRGRRTKVQLKLSAMLSADNAQTDAPDVEAINHDDGDSPEPQANMDPQHGADAELQDEAELDCTAVSSATNHVMSTAVADAVPDDVVDFTVAGKHVTAALPDVPTEHASMLMWYPSVDGLDDLSQAAALAELRSTLDVATTLRVATCSQPSAAYSTVPQYATGAAYVDAAVRVVASAGDDITACRAKATSIAAALCTQTAEHSAVHDTAVLGGSRGWYGVVGGDSHAAHAWQSLATRTVHSVAAGETDAALPVAASSTTASAAEDRQMPLMFGRVGTASIAKTNVEDAHLSPAAREWLSVVLLEHQQAHAEALLDACLADASHTDAMHSFARMVIDRSRRGLIAASLLEQCASGFQRMATNMWPCAGTAPAVRACISGAAWEAAADWTSALRSMARSDEVSRREHEAKEAAEMALFAALRDEDAPSRSGMRTRAAARVRAPTRAVAPSHLRDQAGIVMPLQVWQPVLSAFT